MRGYCSAPRVGGWTAEACSCSVPDERGRCAPRPTRAEQSELVAGGRDAVGRFASQLGLSAVRTDRLAAFGILSGEAQDETIEDMARVPAVEFVERDKEKRAL